MRQLLMHDMLKANHTSNEPGMLYAVNVKIGQKHRRNHQHGSKNNSGDSEPAAFDTGQRLYFLYGRHYFYYPPS